MGVKPGRDSENVWVGEECALVEEKTGGGFPVSNIIEER